MKQDNIRLSGEVIQALGNANFKVTTENGLELICTISGKIRKNYIRITPGDKVDIEISPYDLTKGRIVQRKRIQTNPENNN